MPRKKTPQEYYNECKQKNLDLPIENYVNARTKIKHKCKQGHVYLQMPNDHLSGKACPKCGNLNKIRNRTGKTKKKTPQEYYKECKEKGLDLPVEEYQGSNIKLKHKCKQGHIYCQKPNDHLSGHGCPQCAMKHSIMKTPKQYYKECKEKGLDLPIDDYLGVNVSINHKCNKGHIYLQTPNSHLKGSGCPKCNVKNPKKTHEQYVKECKEKGLDLPIEHYRGNNIPIKHKCKYGHIYKRKPLNHLQGSQCYQCAILNGSKKQRKTMNEYVKDCKVLGYDLPIEDYINSKTKIKHKCNRCDYIYSQTPSDHLYHGTGCPKCNESHGERFIRNYLDRNNIKYIPQKTFKDLKDKTYLSYDFYLPNYNILIEYQGEQHYKVSDYFGGKDKLELQQLHDKMKKDYAKNHGYKLLELHYSLNTQEKVNNFLKRRLK